MTPAWFCNLIIAVVLTLIFSIKDDRLAEICRISYLFLSMGDDQVAEMAIKLDSNND
jgi:hypothetical protein